jgi:hypothetical protein
MLISTRLCNTHITNKYVVGSYFTDNYEIKNEFTVNRCVLSSYISHDLFDNTEQLHD